MRAVFAAFEAATAPDDETERIARLFDCAATSARGANELRSLHLRISDEWGEHPGLDEVAWACGLLAACQACAWSAAMQDEYLNDESPVWIDGGQHWVGLEFCVRKAARLFGSIRSNDGTEACDADEENERAYAMNALRDVADELPKLGIDGVGAAEAEWLQRLAERIEMTLQ